MTDTTAQVETTAVPQMPEEFDGVSDAVDAFSARWATQFGEEQSAEADDNGSDASAEADPVDESASESEGAVQETKPEELHDEGDKLRHQDYTRKTQELAEQRRQFEAQAKQYETHYQQALQQALQVVQSGQDPILAEGAKIDWVKLAADDPSTYIEKRAKYEARVVQVQQMQTQAGEFQKQQMAAIIQAEKPKLLAVVPEWKDAKTAQKEMPEVMSYLKKNGYSDDDVNSLYDHRAVAVARKAWLYDQHVKAQKSLADKKVPPSPVRVTKPSNGEATRTQAPTHRDLKAKLKSSGKIEDAMALIDAKLAAL